MFTRPSFLEPEGPEKSEDISSQQVPADRGTRKEVTPSQRGKFLGALEGKDKDKGKKDVKGVKKEDEEEGDKEGLFGLVMPKKVKEKTTKLTADSDEESEADLSQESTPQAIIPTKRTLDSTSEEGYEEEGYEGEEVEPLDVSQTAQPVKKAEGKFTFPEEDLRPIQKEKPMKEMPKEIHVEERAVKGIEKPHEKLFEQPLKKKEEIKPVVTAQQDAIKKPIELPSNIAKPELVEDAKKARVAMVELVKQVSETIATLASKAVTTISIELKYPPLFAGATLSVTEFATAKNEFNITFSNLSPDARLLIEAQSNQVKLREGLIEKGYALHMITIESPLKVETPTFTQSETGEKKERPRQEESRDFGDQKPY
jgi:hypothetical protein